MDYVKLIISIVLCLSIGFISGFWTKNSISTWYKKLKKPSFNPPNYLFGPVWTLLYILMGVSLYLVWTTNPTTIAITFFTIQLVLNFLWSLIFFKMRKLLLAIIEIILLLISIIITAVLFYPISQTASLLLIPYILWVSFASILNISMYRLN